jgi:hypothetical protein
VRSQWRRTMSLLLNRTQLAAFGEIPLLRLSLRPVDAMYPEVLARWRDLIVRALETHQRATKATWASIAADAVHDLSVH